MTSSPHILILGAGLVGLSSAEALLRRGARVTVVERAPAVMRGASFANSGMIHPSQACNWAGPANDAAVDAVVQDLALESMALLQARMADLGLDSMLARSSGCFQIFDDPSDVDRAATRLQARGVAAEHRAATPDTFGRAALFFPADRSGDARLYGEALARSIVAQGGDIRLSAQTPEIAIGADGLAELRIGADILRADAIVVACGAQSADVLRPFEIDLPVTPVRGWAVDYALPEDFALPDAPIMDAASRSALTKFSDRLRLSGTWDEASVEPLLARWRAIAPDLMAAVAEPLQIWSGLRPVSSAGRPFIDRTSVPNLWVNAGHGHMGWTLCAGSGALLADMISGGREDERFSLAGSP
jgi:D-amino-acid dehydrogenase